MTKTKDDHIEQIPFFVHEGEMVRMERTVKRLWVAAIVVVLLMFATNTLWLLSISDISETLKRAAFLP